MAEEIDRPEQVQIVIECIPDLKRFVDPAGSEGQSFQALLLRQLNDLAIDSGLPMAFLLEVRLMGDEEGFALQPYRVAIDGQPCLFPPFEVGPQGWTAQQMAQSVAKVVYLNRELCVSTAVAERILGNLSRARNKTFLAGFSTETFQRLLKELIRHCVSVDRLKNLEVRETEKEQSNAEWNFETVFESVLTAQGVVSLRVYSNPVINKEMLVEQLQRDMYAELGIMLPKVVEEVDELLAENGFRVKLNDLRFPVAFVEHPAGTTVGETSDSSATSFTTVWYPSVVYPALHEEIKRNAGAFLTVNDLRFRFAMLRQSFAPLVNSALSRFEATRLTTILRTFLDEGLSIKDLRSILEALVGINGTIYLGESQEMAFSPTAPNLREDTPGVEVVFLPETAHFCPTTMEKTMDELDIDDYITGLRISLKRYISYKYTKGTNNLSIFRLAPHLENRVKNLEKHPLQVAEYNQILQAIKNRLVEPGVNSDPVIMTGLATRKQWRNLLSKTFPDLPVLCFQELTDEVHCQLISEITVG